MIRKNKFVWILFTILFIAFGQIFTKLGADDLSKNHSILFFMNLYIILGYSFMILRGLVWIQVLRNVKLSIAYPVISFSYVLIFIISKYLFNEDLNIFKIIGMTLIVTGILIISYGNKRLKNV